MPRPIESNSIFRKLAKEADEQLRILLREHTEKGKYRMLNILPQHFVAATKRPRLFFGDIKKNMATDLRFVK